MLFRSRLVRLYTIAAQRQSTGPRHGGLSLQVAVVERNTRARLARAVEDLGVNVAIEHGRGRADDELAGVTANGIARLPAPRPPDQGGTPGVSVAREPAGRGKGGEAC